MGESPCITYMALYILTFHILQTNSRTSTFWKLNVEDGKITEVNHFPSIVTSTLPNDNGDDPIFNIITSTVHFGKSWTKRSAENYCTDCQSANVSHRQTQPIPINTQAYIHQWIHHNIQAQAYNVQHWLQFRKNISLAQLASRLGPSSVVVQRSL